MRIMEKKMETTIMGIMGFTWYVIVGASHQPVLPGPHTDTQEPRTAKQEIENPTGQTVDFAPILLLMIK